MKLLNILSICRAIYNKKILIVGKRGDLYWKNYSTSRGYDNLWEKSKLHPGCGIDYFIFTNDFFSVNEIDILNKICVGRIQYDNAILSIALRDNKKVVIDCTYVIKAIHLNLPKYEKRIITEV